MFARIPDRALHLAPSPSRARPSFTIQMHEENALGVARQRLRQLVSVKGRRGCLIRAALCLVRLSLKNSSEAIPGNASKITLRHIPARLMLRGAVSGSHQS